MRDQNTWSLRLGHWGDVQIRVHIFFLLFAAISVYLSWYNPGPAPRHVDWIVVSGLLVLICSVLWHEMGHFAVASKFGGAMPQSVLVPWGGLSTIYVPHDPKAEIIAYLAGPAANLVLCVICVPLLIWTSDLELSQLLHPLQPALVTDGSNWPMLLSLTFWVNWLLFLVNLIPAFPFDGGQIFRTALSRVLGKHYAGVAAARVAQMAAFVLLVIAWFVRNSDPSVLVPTWFALVIVAIFLLFSAATEPKRKEPEVTDDELFGYDFSQGYTSLEKSVDTLEDELESPISQWLEQRRRERKRRQVEQEAEEEKRVDEILARLHKLGMAGLSEEDRAILQRVSARYRNRTTGQA